MTKREKHEIAVCVRRIMWDSEINPYPREFINYPYFIDHELIDLYRKLKGGSKGFRDYIHNECVAFWTDFDPYLDEKYLDYEWIEVDGKIVNYDDLWCFIRDCLEGELKEK